jgi:hypothetical protein
MNNTVHRPLLLSRPVWAIALEPVAGVLHALQRGWQRWRAARQRAAEFHALRRMSPGVLRDIGALPEWQNAARYWREQRAAERDALFRGLD